MTSTSNTNIDFEQIQTIISNIIKNTIDDLKLTLSTNSIKKNHYLHSEPTKNLKILILSGF